MSQVSHLCEKLRYMKKIAKYVLWALIALVIGLQFFRPERNLSNDQTYHVKNNFAMPANVENTLKVACDDCHSNQTVYPWYAQVQPVGLWLAQHVNDGKRHLNLSAFTNKPIAYQNHKMEEIIEMVKEGEMPLASYTWVHRNAILSAEQKTALTEWAQSIMDTLKANYPPDSLVMRRG